MFFKRDPSPSGTVWGKGKRSRGVFLEKILLTVSEEENTEDT